MQSLLCAVLVHHRDARTTLEAIDSILASDYPRLGLVVVDCAPEEDSVSVKAIEKGVTVMKAFPDPGASSARNIGIRRAIAGDPGYVLLFDSDTVFRRDCLSRLVDRAMTSENIGAVQPKILSFQDPRKIDTVGQHLTQDGAFDVGMGDTDGPDYAAGREVFGVSSAAALYSVKALRKVGLCDEDLQFMFEDVDLSWRIRLAGYRCVYEPTAIAYHLRRSTGSGAQSLHRKSLQWRNWLLISTRYFPADLLARCLPRAAVHALAAFLIEFLRGHGGGFARALVRGEVRSLIVRRKLRRLLETSENRSFITS